MAGYVIVDVDVHDVEGYREYGTMVGPTVEAFGGRFLVRGGEWERMEGEWQPKRLVVLEFPTVDDARRWYSSEEYREALELRRRTASADLLIVDGV